ncbi:MAG: hypothetical protein ABJ314_01570 [Ilumatobacter sp.]|uniref:hypothetical protein n=1 Tax=Ilumatobacter sp. TaxID=1967498 RepID=UPI0032984F5E
MTVRAQEPGTRCTGKVPVGAISLSLNVTTVGATSQSFLTIWAGGTRPDASSLNPSPGAPPTPNAVTVDLSVDQTFDIYNDLGNVNVVVDINGYYENHAHDDRYYTEGESDHRFVRQASTIDLAPSSFHPVDNGWDLGAFDIPRVFTIAGRRCAVAPIDVSAGTIVTAVAVNYQNFAASTTLQVRVLEAELLDDRPIGGRIISDATVVLPSFASDLTVGLATAAATDPTGAGDAVVHHVEMCTTNDRVAVHAVQLTTT